MCLIFSVTVSHWENNISTLLSAQPRLAGNITMTIISVMYLKVTVTLVSPLLFFCGYYNSKKTKWNVTMLAYTVCSGRDLHNEAIFILLLAMFDFNCLFKEVLVLFLLGSNLEFTGCCYGRNIVSLESHFLRHRPTELLSHAKCAYDFFPLCLVSNGQSGIISKKKSLSSI